MYFDDFDKSVNLVLIILIIVCMIVGWCVIEGIIWLYKHVSISFI